MNETAAIATPAVEEFHASVNVEDASVYVSAKTLPAFLAMLARLGVSGPAAASVSAPVGASSTACDDQLRPEPAPAKETPKAEKPKAEKTAAASTPAEAPSSAPAAQTASDAKPSADASAPAAEVSYDQLRAAIFKLAAQDKAAAGEVVASFGVKSFKDLDASRWAEALAAVNAKLEG